MPSLGRWLAQFGIASVVSVLITFITLRFMQRDALAGDIAGATEVPPLSLGGRLAAGGIAVTAVVLLVASGLDWSLGEPTFIAALVTAVVILLLQRMPLWTLVKGISWSVLPLVAGLFVLVEAIEGTGVLKPLMAYLAAAAAAHPDTTALGAGALVAVACNLVNNLPLGLIAGTVASGAQLSPHVTGALLVGVDLGPNLSVTGSLATILWLVALRREGQAVSAWTFLKLGTVVMPLALIASLASFIWLKF
jgi:arsenical pump membrane protein